jgi:hypothetical protein
MGAFLMGKREVIDQIGGWDNDYPLWWEDLQFCTDTRKKGFLLYYYPQVKLIHYEGKSAAQEMSLFKQKRFNKGMRIYFKKNVSYFTYLVISIFSPFSLFLAWLSGKLHIKQRPQSKI